MSATAYRLLGFAVWRLARWYVRHRMPSRRALLGRAVLAGLALLTVALVARRVAG